ncbi:hypothetical protein SUGI_0498590 [Cryptomeria japonica]|uniref:uncharacterized protein LOC131062014 n=1 Tax=Cryptomeria japonica TaxID=3369 RepID=UPI002408F1AC|nr:uncharacterized protein LOC131062014 [Cryptomeria japonica]GLJ25993.1 hypothetical protein SUGI_0498590 [Cryptomeria japonica]
MGDSEFWLLLLVYIQHILTKQKTVNPNFNAVEQQILPLLERFNFLSECKDLRALSGIIDSLKADGFVLPFDTRKQLCRRLLRHATNANTVKEAQGLVDYAKQIVDCNFHALCEANQGLGFQKGCNENMIYVVEERICSAIFEEDILLQYMTEKIEEEGGDEGEGGLVNSRLAFYLQNGMQSQNTETRLLAIKLACACGFNSRIIFSKLLPIFEVTLYYEDFLTREYVLASLMDLIFLHHSSISLQTVFHFIFPFLYAPTPALQLVSVIGCGRLLLYNCFSEETECLLSKMIERHLYRFPVYCSLKGKLQKVDQALYIFFSEYSGEKKLHQDEICNTLVYMCLQKIEEGVVCVDTVKKQIEDNPLKAREASELHLALNFGLSLCSDALDAVVDSLILNVNDDLGISLLDKAKCVQWFLSK